MRPETVREKLALAAEHQLIVRLERGEIEEGHFDGYVSRLGERFFALAVIDDNVHINGFACLRYEDVTRIILPPPNEHFLVKALNLRGEYPPTCPPIDLTSALSLIRSACDHIHIVSVHPEIDDPETCWIGRLRSSSDELVVLDLVSPGGDWEVDPFQVELKHVTRVDFGGEYENALMLVAGPRPDRLGS